MYPLLYSKYNLFPIIDLLSEVGKLKNGQHYQVDQRDLTKNMAQCFLRITEVAFPLCHETYVGSASICHSKLRLAPEMQTR